MCIVMSNVRWLLLFSDEVFNARMDQDIMSLGRFALILIWIIEV